ncbi:vascular endothelial growth factor receptor 1 isoform X2 [Ostrinia nubilalis]|uniref:vascular endothelial growth factor receptor 1 isoform X2 n=1 Tax=Ostrinia nubilalis TaxID=29057 RepID=UPI0030824F29
MEFFIMKSSHSCWLFITALGIVLATATVAANYAGTPDIQDTSLIGPNLYPKKNEIILRKGQNFTFTCNGNRPLDIKQQVLPEDCLTEFVMELDDEDPLNVSLTLYNVDYCAVGYYACFDDTIDPQDILTNFIEEPNNTEHVTYTYVYVDGPMLFAPVSEFIETINENKFLLQCKPAMPDTEMSLTLEMTESEFGYDSYDPRIGMIVSNEQFADLNIAILVCGASRHNKMDYKYFLYDKNQKQKPKMDIEVKITKAPSSKYFMKGESFTLNCTVTYLNNSPYALEWTKPRKDKDTDIIVTNEESFGQGSVLYNTLTIANADVDDQGNYTCVLATAMDNPPKNSVLKQYLETPFINLQKHREEQPLIIGHKLRSTTMQVTVAAYPHPTFSFFRDNKSLSIDNVKYAWTFDSATRDIRLTIKNVTVYDSGNYTIVAKNFYLTETATYDLRKKAPPVVDFGSDSAKVCSLDALITFSCKAIGYPLPNIQWLFSDGVNETTLKRDIKLNKVSEYQIESTIKVKATTAGNITCKAENNEKSALASKKLIVYEIDGGFGIEESPDWYSENDRVTLRCLASVHEYTNVFWRGKDDNDIQENVIYYDSPFSHVAKLDISHASQSHEGKYTCVGKKLNNSEEHQVKNIVVYHTREPTIIEPEMDNTDRDFLLGRQAVFTCLADAVPPPQIIWTKDGMDLQNITDQLEILNYSNRTKYNSTVVIKNMEEAHQGKYECNAFSNTRSITRVVNVEIKGGFKHTTKLLGAISAIILALIGLVIYLTWKIRKEKQFRKELAAAGLLYFKEGVTSSLNPDLGIDEQAELLPYDEKFEFPPEKLKLGTQLGAGAFGVVYKAEARGIVNAEETTLVAVKMVKKTADNMYIKALASELKIMVHMGKHVNIVNLLGACTKNVGKRELIVIVEYCKFGNIHNYMQKHREVFIDQLTDNKEKNLGKVNRGYSCSSGSSGMNSDYFGMNHTQATDQTVLNSANTNRSARKVSEAGYIQPEWRSNYESDYSFDGRNPRPLTSRDLLAWAFQIARGMEYLASRKVLHGDLAARNVLLAEDNIVKICDFGLARSIYKNDEYQKKENSPLPVKWLAIECMMDRIFSTQSDVWSFGIVLWEMFSLAKTPYPNMSPQNLLQWLSEGHRLEKPPYADDRLYDVMMRCWEHKPTARPSFTQLQELLGSFLEDNVRNHYVDLNSSYMDMNVKAEGQDYLQMVCAPDYNNLVTPSPHHYVNSRSFFPPTPTQVPLDEEGYLQMTPANASVFSPRAQNTKFDFDARKFDPRMSEGNGGSELTPMLTLSNLPARSGSESDHEGHSPYLKMCPRISEESDDVFKPNINNIKNNIQNSAVSNPTYITALDMDLEKKPQNVNTYINMPNGLVK